MDEQTPTGYAQVAEELTNDAVTRRYTYGLTRISQSQIINNNWTTHWFVYDGGMSVRALTDSSGSMTDTMSYDAFGNLIARTGTTPVEMLYRGEQYDVGLAFYNLRARWMNPQVGRFLTMDTWDGVRSDPKSIHKYLYAIANPVNIIDPSGNIYLEEEVYTEKVLEQLVAGLVLLSVFVLPDILNLVHEKIKESECTYGGGIPLYRTMKIDGDEKPVIEQSKNGLGVVEGADDGADIKADSEGNVGPVSPTKGMSVTPWYPPFMLRTSPHRLVRPFGGRATGAKGLFCINSAFVDATIGLHYVPDPEKKGLVLHGLIEPSYRMPTQNYRDYLASTKAYWVLIIDNVIP